MYSDLNFRIIIYLKILYDMFFGDKVFKVPFPSFGFTPQNWFDYWWAKTIFQKQLKISIETLRAIIARFAAQNTFRRIEKRKSSAGKSTANYLTISDDTRSHKNIFGDFCQILQTFVFGLAKLFVGVHHHYTQ